VIGRLESRSKVPEVRLKNFQATRIEPSQIRLSLHQVQGSTLLRTRLR